jgi:hypothetical protein
MTNSSNCFDYNKYQTDKNTVYSILSLKKKAKQKKEKYGNK